MNIETSIQALLAEADTSSEKVCFPVHNKNNDFTLSHNLNSASHYCIVDFESKASYFLELKDIQEIFWKSNGNGFQALKISSIICEGVAPMALKILSDSDISVWKPKGSNIQENIKLFQTNKLSGYINEDGSYSSSCSTSSCSTCSSTCN